MFNFTGRLEKILQFWGNYVGKYVPQDQNYVHKIKKIEL